MGSHSRLNAAALGRALWRVLIHAAAGVGGCVAAMVALLAPATAQPTDAPATIDIGVAIKSNAWSTIGM